MLISASLFIAIGGAKTTTTTTTSTTTTMVTTSPDSSGLKVVAENLTITFPSGSSSGAAPLANFVANHSGYIVITGPAGGGAYYYVQVVNPLAAQNETVPYPSLGPLVIPISPGSITMSLSYRDYGDIDVLNTAHLTIVYYYYPSGIGPVEAVSVVGPIPPYNPGGPTVTVTLENAGDAPIASLNATLSDASPATNLAGFNGPYSFEFNASSSNPLLPAQSAQDTRTLTGAGFTAGTDYPLTINGSFANGTRFSYTVPVQVVPPG